MDNIDKLTLELLINKTQYRKYLAKAEPTKSKEYEEHLEHRQLYKDSILALTENLLEDPHLQINTEINEIFETYVKTLIKYFQIKEIEDRPDFFTEEEDENMLFGERAFSHTNVYVKSQKKSAPLADTTLLENSFVDTPHVPTTQSFWGKNIRKNI
jgi:hypothetical protein